VAVSEPGGGDVGDGDGDRRVDEDVIQIFGEDAVRWQEQVQCDEGGDADYENKNGRAADTRPVALRKEDADVMENDERRREMKQVVDTET
jgi:hypothetical protein